MIPKIIHYCWFGRGERPELVEKCIASWKRFCPDYDIIEWNEDNFDINYNLFAKEAYEAKKYAFVSDVARLVALIKYGGFYFDTDEEIIKPIDEFLCYDGVGCFFNEAESVGTSFLAAKPDFPLMKEFLAKYDGIKFKKENVESKRGGGTFALTPNNFIFTELCLQKGLELKNTEQKIDGFTVFPSEYFSPRNSITKKLKITNKTYAIHYFDCSWNSEIHDYAEKLKKKFGFLPNKVTNFIAFAKFRGIGPAVRAARTYISKAYVHNKK